MKNYTIYKILSKDPTIKQEYIGSTSNLSRRINEHKYNCLRPTSMKHNYKLYKFIRKNGGWYNFYFRVLEVFPSNDKIEVYKRENSYIEKNQFSLNCQKAFLNKDQYNKDYYQICKFKKLFKIE